MHKVQLKLIIAQFAFHINLCFLGIKTFTLYAPLTSAYCLAVF